MTRPLLILAAAWLTVVAAALALRYATRAAQLRAIEGD